MKMLRFLPLLALLLPGCGVWVHSSDAPAQPETAERPRAQRPHNHRGSRGADAAPEADPEVSPESAAEAAPAEKIGR